MYALAGTPTANTYPSSYLYQNSSGLARVKSGSNGTCESSHAYLCNAADSLSDGYNGPAGLGTPYGSLTPFTETSSDVISVSNPGTYNLQTGVKYSLPAIKAYNSASGKTLTYAETGLPSGLSMDESTGAITGTVFGAVNDTVHVTVTDGAGGSAAISFRLVAV